MEYIERDYRRRFRQEDLSHFQAVYRETDLDIGVPAVLYGTALKGRAEEIIRRLRREMDDYIARDPAFFTSLTPHPVLPGAPALAVAMARAAEAAGVGPMAAVAGAFAQAVAEELLAGLPAAGGVGQGPMPAAPLGAPLTRPGWPDIIVENGGDIFLRTSTVRKIGIFAGPSPLSMKVALVISPTGQPLGICTSSGTVGPSLSFGKADAAVILSPSAALADAAASAVGNIVQHPADVENGVKLASTIPGVSGALVIAGERMAAWGDIKLAPL